MTSAAMNDAPVTMTDEEIDTFRRHAATGNVVWSLTDVRELLATITDLQGRLLIAEGAVEIQGGELTRATEEYRKAHTRAEALEAENARMREALTAYVKEFSHSAPDDCYSTGPMTGDFIQDHVACPGCAVLAKARAALNPGEQT